MSSDLTDPVIQHHLWRARLPSLSGYLLALAAFQRGLHIQFFSHPARVSKRFQQLDYFPTGTVFQRVSDGDRQHDFWESMGDVTTKTQSLICDDKRQTRWWLQQQSLPCPPSIVINPGEHTVASSFFDRYSDHRFVLKPVVGSQGNGVVTNLTVTAAWEYLQQITGPHILECYVAGTEYRVSVVGGKSLFVYQRKSPMVFGNGHSTVAELIYDFNEQRTRNPFFCDDIINVNGDLQYTISQQGYSLSGVVPDGQTVILGESPISHDGWRLHVDPKSLSSQTRQVLRRMAQSLGIVNIGIDIVETANGSPVILDVNQRHDLRCHVYPDNGLQDNVLAEQIIDHYFPESVSYQRWPQASFDYQPVHNVLSSNQHADVSIPALQTNWQQYRLDFSQSQSAQFNAHNLQRLFQRHGVFGHVVPNAEGGWLTDVLCTPKRWARLREDIEGSQSDYFK